MNTDTKSEIEKFKEALIARIRGVDDARELIKLYNSISDTSTEGSSSMPKDSREQGGKEGRYNDYPKQSSYRHKVAFVLSKESKFLNLNEITNIIYRHEPELTFGEVKSGVSSAKSSLLKNGAIVKYVVGSSNQNSFYGSSNWLDENGNPKPEHIYNEESLVVKEEVKI